MLSRCWHLISGYQKAFRDAIAARLIVRAPPDVAAAVHNEIVTGTVEGTLARFLVTEKEHHYQSANYETATKRVDIQIGGDNSSVEFV